MKIPGLPISWQLETGAEQPKDKAGGDGGGLVGAQGWWGLAIWPESKRHAQIMGQNPVPPVNIQIPTKIVD